MIAKAFLPEDLAQAATIARLARVSTELVEEIARRLGLRALRGGWYPALRIWEELERLAARQHTRFRRARRRETTQAARQGRREISQGGNYAD